jgi:hypothetical protein
MTVEWWHRAVAAKGARVKAASCSEAACPWTKQAQAHANRRRQGAAVKVKGDSQGERDRRGTRGLGSGGLITQNCD